MWNKILQFFPASTTEKFSISDNSDATSSPLRKATAEKEAGNLDEAINLLRRAYELTKIEGMECSVETFLRLPMYLQKAGRNGEAWREFNILLTHSYPNQNKDPQLVPMANSIVYDKMRLFLQRENKNDLAVRFGVCSYVSWAVGLYRQKRKNELKDCIDQENIEYNVEKLLKKARKIHLQDKLVKTVKEQLAELPNINFAQLSRVVDGIVFQENKKQ